MEFVWILLSRGRDDIYLIKSFYTNFIEPKPDHALGQNEFGYNELGVAEKQSENWELDITYYADFSIDPPTDELVLQPDSIGRALFSERRPQ